MIVQATGEMCAVKIINKKKVGMDILECELAVIKHVMVEWYSLENKSLVLSAF